MKMSQEEFDKFVQTKEIPEGFTKEDLLETGIDQINTAYGPNGKQPSETAHVGFLALLLMAYMAKGKNKRSKKTK